MSGSHRSGPAPNISRRENGGREGIGTMNTAPTTSGPASVGDSYDNALAETINGFCKAELIHRRGSWRTMEAVGFAMLGWVDWFNNRRLLEPIGNIKRGAG